MDENTPDRLGTMSTLESPPTIPSGRVVAQFVVGIIDGPDSGDEPDLIPAIGTIEFYPLVPYVPVPTGDPNGFTLIANTFVGVLDSEGYLCTPLPGKVPTAGPRGVRLFATDFPGGSVEGWTWRVTCRFQGSAASIPPFNISVPAGSTIDLSSVVKVPQSQGLGTEQIIALAAKSRTAAEDAASSAKNAAEEASSAGITAYEASQLSEQATAVARLAESSVIDLERRLEAGEFGGGGGTGGTIAPTGWSHPWPELQMLAPVKDGHGYSSGGTFNSVNMNDTSDAVIGTHCISLVTDPAGAQGWIRTPNFAPVDMTDKGIVVWVKVEGGESIWDLSYLVIDVFTASNNNSRWRGYIMDPNGMVTMGDWVAVPVPWANLMTINGYGGGPLGNPDRTKVTAVEIMAASKNNRSLTLKIGGIGAYRESTARYPKGVVSLTFDDSYESAFTLAARKMSEYGYVGTLYPIQSLLGKDGRLTMEQVRNLHTFRGWEVGAHATTETSHTSYTDLTDVQIEQEMVALRKWQQDNGFAPSSFAYPVGSFNASVIEQVSKYYPAARGNYDQITTPNTLQPYRVSAIALDPSVTLAAMKKRIDEVVAGKGWQPIVVRNIGDAATGYNEWTTENFNSLVDYIESSGVAVATFGEVISGRGVSGVQSLSIEPGGSTDGSDVSGLLHNPASYRGPMGLFQAGLTLTRTTGRPLAVGFAGSSTTAGNNTAPAKRWVNLLASRLTTNPVLTDTEAYNQRGSLPPGINVVNAGINGSSSATYLSDGRDTRLSSVNPRLVVHTIGSNDYGSNTSPQTYRAGVLAAIARIDAQASGPVAHLLVHSYERYDVPERTYQWYQYRDALISIALERPDRVTFLDLSATFRSLGIPSTDALGLMQSDRLHMNDYGHAFYADLIAMALDLPQTPPSVPVVVPPSSGPVSVSDDFARADGPLGVTPVGGAAWATTVGDVRLQGGLVTALVANAGAFVNTGITDGTVGVTGMRASQGLLFRCNPDGSGYYFMWSGGGQEYRVGLRTASGTFTPLAGTGTTRTFATGARYEVEMAGSSIKCRVNGNLVLEVTDSTHRGTRHGITFASLEGAPLSAFRVSATA